MEKKSRTKWIKEFSTKHMTGAVVLTLLLSLLPLYFISFYNHPSVDDYYYGTGTHKVWEKTGSVQAAVKESYQNTWDTYEDWQGNFVAIFLMGLQPGIFSEEAYVFSAFLLLTSYLLCGLFFFTALFRRCFKAEKSHAVLAAAVLVFVSMQFTHVPSDAFYWYNGSIYYTFFYSLAMLLSGLLIWTLTSHKLPVQISCTFLSGILAFLIGGSNYTSAFITILLLVSGIVILLYRGRREAGRALLRVLPLLLVLAAVSASFIISVSSPGNAVRQASVGGSNGVLKSILLSFVYGGYSAANAAKLPVVLTFIFLAPFFYITAKRSGYRFRHPLAVLFFSFCLYSAQITPVIYAQGIHIPYRIMNIIYFSFYIMAAGNLLYLMGYLGRAAAERGWGHKIEDALQHVKRNTFLYFVLFLTAFGCACIGGIEINGEEGDIQITGLPMSVSAAYSLVTGEAAVYDKEAKARLVLYEDESLSDIEVKPFTKKPNVLFHTDITEDPGHWKNTHVSNYYGKKSVRLSGSDK